MITFVVGAQYGGEGKGKICAYVALAERVDVACRCGGPNSCHTVSFEGVEHRLRMMPAAAVVRPKIDVYFGAGTLIHIPTLFSEMKAIGFSGRLAIDPRAGIITDDIVDAQRADKRYESIGSTLTGTGFASALRASRKLRLAAEFSELHAYLDDVSLLLQRDLGSRRNILVEGHQGFGLSNYHGDYPYVSSRDCTVAEMLSELGLPPTLGMPGGRRIALRVILATKVFPTRNHAGSLPNELPPNEASQFGIEEFGGGSWGIPNRRRRVGIFDVDLVRKAAWANGASEIALTGTDYLDKTLKGTRTRRASEPLDHFLAGLRSFRDLPPVRYLSTGPGTEETVDLMEVRSRFDDDLFDRPEAN